MSLDSLEGSHRSSIDKLVEEFGTEEKEEIKMIYSKQKDILEKDAKIKNFVPVFAYKITRQILRAEHEDKYLKKQAKKLNKKYDF